MRQSNEWMKLILPFVHTIFSLSLSLSFCSFVFTATKWTNVEMSAVQNVERGKKSVRTVCRWRWGRERKWKGRSYMKRVYNGKSISSRAKVFQWLFENWCCWNGHAQPVNTKIYVQLYQQFLTCIKLPRALVRYPIFSLVFTLRAHKTHPDDYSRNQTFRRTLATAHRVSENQKKKWKPFIICENHERGKKSEY